MFIDFREKEREGRSERERMRERNIDLLPPYAPQLGIEPTTYVVP